MLTFWLMRAVGVVLVCGLAACGSLAPQPVAGTSGPTRLEPPADLTRDDDPVPARLPAGVVPTHYTLALTIDPARSGFEGTAEIGLHLSGRQARIWLHGKALAVASVVAIGADGRAIAGTWRERDPAEGLARITLAEPVGPGDVRLQIAYAAPFDATLNGLYRVDVGSDHYAFTQFEDIAARNAFPCFDEPGFKTPYDVTLVAPRALGAFANTRQLGASPAGPEQVRHVFATTAPLPPYLVAWAVGPLEVAATVLPPSAVRAQPLDLRVLAPRGHGAELAYALAETPPIVTALEDWFQRPYPFDKLDLVAVPDFDAGAMENAGLLMFRDHLLLLGADPPIAQQRNFVLGVAHELAHQWFGDLVTMAWWDDLWLNEAFATWMEPQIVRALGDRARAFRPDVIELGTVGEAFDADAFVDARQIRQPVATRDDIANAFDAITYSKGASVLMTLSRWLGPEVFRRGVQRYLAAHAGGNATTADLLAALSAESGRAVAPVLDGLTLRSGIPLLATTVTCDAKSEPQLTFAQQRYVPLGTPPEAARAEPWTIPVCVRYAFPGAAPATTCTLVTTATATLTLPGKGCPAWVLPNADGGSYLRFTLPDAWVTKLASAPLETRDRMTLADSVEAGFGAGTIGLAAALQALAPMAASEDRPVALAPIELLIFAHRRLLTGREEDAFRRYGRGLYRAQRARLGWGRPGDTRETSDDRLLRAGVLGFLAREVRDPEVRREAARRGCAYVAGGSLHPEAVAPDLRRLALEVAIQEGDDRFFDAVVATLAGLEDGQVRSDILWALSSDDRPERRAGVLALALDPRLRVNEIRRPLVGAFDSARGAEVDRAWAWFTAHYDAVRARLSPEAAGALVEVAGELCDPARVAGIQAFFGPRLADTVGGPRNLATVVASIARCAAIVRTHEAAARAFFGRR